MTEHVLKRPRRRERVLVSRISDRVALFDVDVGTYYALNDVGGRIWELCDGSRRVHDVVAVIREEYDAPPHIVAADVSDLLADLARENLIVEGEGSGPAPS
jgi:pyrroloquinoline quinone biosynthesis protein D